MAKFESNLEEINKSTVTVFNFLSDFNNFEKLMPEQVINWKSTELNCSFTIKGMADIAMQISEKIPYSKVVIIPEGETKLRFNLVCLTNVITENKCSAQIIIEADINPMMSMMVSKPLQNFVNILAQRLKELMEKQ